METQDPQSIKFLIITLAAIISISVFIGVGIALIQAQDRRVAVRRLAQAVPVATLVVPVYRRRSDSWSTSKRKRVRRMLKTIRKKKRRR